MRGIPGSGKTRAARLLREAETAHAGGGVLGRSARVISLDDYFLVEDEESGEMRYEWEEGMEDDYRTASVRMLKKALDTKRSSADFQPVIIVDAPNLLVAHLNAYVEVVRAAPGTAVYVLEMRGENTKNAAPSACGERNVHGWTVAQVESMAANYEPNPPDLPLLMLRALDPESAARTAHASEGVREAPTDDSALAQLPSVGAQTTHECGGANGSDVGGTSSLGVVRRMRSPPPPAASKWDVDDDDDDDETAEEVQAELPTSAEGARPEAASLQSGSVRGDVGLLGGLLGSYAKTTKRVRWADIEAAKDEEFARTQAGFTLKGAAPLSRKRIRSPPPAERQEQA